MPRAVAQVCAPDGRRTQGSDDIMSQSHSALRWRCVATTVSNVACCVTRNSSYTRAVDPLRACNRARGRQHSLAARSPTPRCPRSKCLQEPHGRAVGLPSIRQLTSACNTFRSLLDFSSSVKRLTSSGLHTVRSNSRIPNGLSAGGHVVRTKMQAAQPTQGAQHSSTSKDQYRPASFLLHPHLSSAKMDRRSGTDSASASMDTSTSRTRTPNSISSKRWGAASIQRDKRA